MATTNDITGNLLVSKSSEAYRDNYDKIFRKSTEVKFGGCPSCGKQDCLVLSCTRSHPHENMIKECEELTVVARENYYKALENYKEKQ